MKKERDSDQDSRYKIQTNLLRNYFNRFGKSLYLDSLLQAMRKNRESAVYFCGGRRDHDFCMISEDIGALLSVLPEDADKSAEPGYHPGSTEVYIVFQGQLVMETLEWDRLASKTCNQYSVMQIPRGVCHRVKYQPDVQAASLIVKTNLKYKPSVVRCSECTYFDDPQRCELHLSWKEEKGVNLCHLS